MECDRKSGTFFVGFRRIKGVVTVCLLKGFKTGGEKAVSIKINIYRMIEPCPGRLKPSFITAFFKLFSFYRILSVLIRSIRANISGSVGSKAVLRRPLKKIKNQPDRRSTAALSNYYCFWPIILPSSSIKVFISLN